MTNIRAVILDVDSNAADAQAWADALHADGYDVELQRIRQLIGMGGDNLLPEVASCVTKD